MGYRIVLRPVFSVNSKTMFCRDNIFLISATLDIPKSLKQEQCIFTNNNNIRINLEACNTRWVSASSWLQTFITWFPVGEIKYSVSLEIIIIKGIDLGRIPELNSITYCFFVSINLISVLTDVQKLFPGIFCSKL